MSRCNSMAGWNAYVDAPKGESCEGPGAVPQTSAVNSAVGFTAGHMEKLESLLGTLEARLAPVLRNIPRPARDEQGVCETTGCQLSDEIHGLGVRVGVAVGHVSELLDRLGV